MNCIYAINGPVVKVRDTKSFSMREMVMVGKSKLIGEVIGVTDEMTTICLLYTSPSPRDTR